MVTHPKKGGARAVLERDRKHKKKPFIIRKFSAPQAGEKGLLDWDLGLFRLPRRQDLSKAPVVEKVKTLDLAFQSVRGRPKSCVLSIRTLLTQPTRLDKTTFVDELTELRNFWTIEQNEYTKQYEERKRMSGN